LKLANKRCGAFGLKSHPVRVRGLKRIFVLLNKKESPESHPVRVRGLKLETVGDLPKDSKVAPRAGAWVETSVSQMRAPV